MKSIVGLAIYALIFVFILIFWPDFNTNDLEYNKAKVALKKVKVSSYTRSFKLECTEKELAAVIRLATPPFWVQGVSWGNVAPREVLVKFTGPQSFDITITYHGLNDYIPFNIVYSIALPTNDQLLHKLTVSGTSIGLLPVPKALVSSLMDSALKALEHSKLALVMNRVKWGTIEYGKMTLYSRVKR